MYFYKIESYQEEMDANRTANEVSYRAAETTKGDAPRPDPDVFEVQEGNN